MPINIIAPITPASPLTAAPQGLRAWQLGQLLTARVLGQTDGTITLDIDGAVLTTRSPVQLSVGRSITLQVVSLGEQPVLQMVRPAPAQTDNTLVQALRVALPKQTPLAPLLANLGWLAENTDKALATLPRNVTELGQHLFFALPDREKVSTARGLLQALKNSGLFLEAKLAHAASHPANAEEAQLADDFKGGLLRLQAALNAGLDSDTAPAPSPRTAEQAQATSPAPLRGTLQAQPAQAATLADTQIQARAGSELRHQIEGGLARIQLHQLNSVPSDNTTLISLDLPIRQGERTDVFQLCIDAQHHRSAQADTSPPAYSVKLAFDLPGLGPVQASISLRDHAVSVLFWAQQEPAIRLINEHLAALRQGVEQAGLTLDHAACLPGPPAPPEVSSLPRLMSVTA